MTNLGSFRLGGSRGSGPGFPWVPGHPSPSEPPGVPLSRAGPGASCSCLCHRGCLCSDPPRGNRDAPTFPSCLRPESCAPLGWNPPPAAFTLQQSRCCPGHPSHPLRTPNSSFPQPHPTPSPTGGSARGLAWSKSHPNRVYLNLGIDSPHVAAVRMAVAWHSRFPIPWTVVLRRNNCFLLF